MSYETLKARVEENLQIRAYITIQDALTGENVESIYSAYVNKNFKQVVQQIDAMTVSSAHQTALADMFALYKQAVDVNGDTQDLMAGWGLANIPGYAPTPVVPEEPEA